ncbi:DUF222 domain-containing protein [Mycolicibacterium sp. XJ1819]
MFTAEFSSADDATVVAAIEECARAEAAVAARRLAAITELTVRRTEPDGEHENWVVDGWACAAAEVAAAMGIGRRAASREMRIGMALQESLPKVAELFAAGRLSAQLVSTITWRTQLVVDGEPQRQIDAAIAERAEKWGKLSLAQLDRAIDALIETYDPGAKRRFREAVRNRDVQFGKPDDETGTTSMWGSLLSTDAKLLQRRIARMADEVCDDDPRTEGERRSDAAGVIAAGGDHLACKCGAAECPSAGEDPRAGKVVVNIIADEATVQTATKEPAKPKEAKKAPAALILGGGVVPTPLLAELIKNGATVKMVEKRSAATEPRYRPSRRLARFIRMRDMTCRFPGCDRPAEVCDVDHTTPYPAGPTHPSNTKCLCRLHHLLKTFWGWLDEQRPDGTVIWTAPSGRTYVTRPSSRLYFPEWNTATAELPAVPPPPQAPNRTAMMPRRRQTRAEYFLRRIMAERALNDGCVGERDKPPPS